MSGVYFLYRFYGSGCNFYANSVDPVQTSRSATSDLDLYCLPMSLWDARYKLVKKLDFKKHFG